MIPDARTPSPGIGDAASVYPAWQACSELGRLRRDAPRVLRDGVATGISALEIEDPVVTALLFKQIVTMDEVDRAWRRLQDDPAGPRREALWRVLVDEAEGRRERIYTEAAALAGIRRFDTDPERARKVMEEHIEAFSRRDWARLLKLRVLPVARVSEMHTRAAYVDDESGGLVFISHDPTRPDVARLLRQLGVDHYELRYASESLVESIIASFVEADATEEASADRPPSDVGSTEQSVPEAGLIEKCLAEAVRGGASAVHVCPTGPRGVRIEARVEGRLCTWHEDEQADAAALLRAFKQDMTFLDASRCHAAQAGSAIREVDGRRVRLSVSILPIRNGEHLTVRIYPAHGGATGDPAGESVHGGAGLDAIGLPEEVVDAVERVVRRRRGLVVVTGPPGSGRGRTVAAVAAEIAARHSVVVSLADDTGAGSTPGVVSVRLSAGLTAEDAFGAAARHDADAVVVGDLLSRETAERALALAGEGRLVLATMSEPDGAAVVTRLLRLGIHPIRTAQAVELVVSQRHLKRLCRTCRVPATHVDGALLRRIGCTPAELAGAAFRDAGADPGCPGCEGTGYDGVFVAAAAMEMTDALRRRIALSDPQASQPDGLEADEIRLIELRDGAPTVSSWARAAAVAGEITLEELLRVAASVP